MATRGRKSAASLTVAKSGIGVAERLEAPLHISDSENEVWAQVVNDQPAGAFTETHAPLLEMYCRHVVNYRVIGEELMNFDRSWLTDEDGLKRYDTLLRIAERESRSASSLATRLRITRQAVDHPTTAGRAIANDAKFKPWDDQSSPFAKLKRAIQKTHSQITADGQTNR